MFLAEGVINIFAPTFPFTELIAAQGVAFGAYMGAKTTNNIKDKKYSNGN
jgi:hypothetical protein